MLIHHWFIDAYNDPVAPYVLRGFQLEYLSVLSNAQDQYLSKIFLRVQGVVYLSQLCPQTAVLRPRTCLSESLNMFASSLL
jgi:hypothetical protein